MTVTNYSVHATAIIDYGAEIGEHTRIWHWAHVSSGAKIGSGCSLGQNVYVGSRAVVGNGVKIQNNVSVYDDVIIEDDVFCGPSCVFTNVVNPRAFVVRKDEYLMTVIKKGASLGANCTIVCGSTVGEFAFIGAGATVTRDVPPFALMVGAPARQIGWMSAYGERLPFPLQGDGEAKCPNDGSHYRLLGNVVTRTPAA
jgi:UDP-2-acetamido-3-amino-2,3-dideoxy-glucuronate N-acetyltransferase